MRIIAGNGAILAVAGPVANPPRIATQPTCDETPRKPMAAGGSVKGCRISGSMLRPPGGGGGGGGGGVGGGGVGPPGGSGFTVEIVVTGKLENEFP